MKTTEIIDKLNPCREGVEYLRKYQDLKTAWRHCERGDWMLWLARMLGVDLRVLTLAKGMCANTVRHLMKNPRSIVAVDAAIAFGQGGIAREDLDAAYAAAAAAAADAAYAAYATARKANQQQTADICREILTEAVMEAAERGE